MERVKIVIDAFGCDKPEAVAEGVAKTVNLVPDVELLVCGDAGFLEKELAKYTFDVDRVEIINADEVITNNDKPVVAIRSKRNSSLSVALRTLKEREDVKAMVSAGSTGAVLCGSILILGRCTGVERPSLASILPTDNGSFTCMLDCGANVDCRAEHLLRFAQFGVAYMKSVYSLESPKVGLLSVGTEDEKGNELTKQAFTLLKESGLNFVGNVEAKTVLTGYCDVIVTDGFAGNVLLKSIEGTAKSVAKRSVELLLKHAPKETDLGFVKKAFAELNSTMDFNSMGGGVLLGVKKIVVKAHGSANADTVVNTVKQALSMYKGGFSEALND